MRYKSFSLGQSKIKRSTPYPRLKSSATTSTKSSVHHCLSSPSLVLESKKTSVPIRSFSTANITTHTHSMSKNIPVCHNQVNIKYTSLRSYSKACDAGCPCPFPCGPCGCKCGCSCLPPPCNTPPRCIQYMTGYYYYPYGTWFCGPYHVQGTCVPVPRPGCVPCKCCPACICPAGAVFNPSEMNQPSSFPNHDVTTPPIYDPTKRPGVSKWLPNCFPRTPTFNPKNPIPPVISSIVCGSYGAQNAAAQQNVSQSVQDAQFPSEYYHQSQVRASTVNNRTFDPQKKVKSPICHKRYKHYHQCPQLDKPKTILTKEERDHPRIRPDSFNYSTIPQYKNPYPRPYEEL
ncbi:unnamed protein product [Colias eurytheme]|nr:unnamed protein product [Colias eurytheme]